MFDHQFLLTVRWCSSTSVSHSYTLAPLTMALPRDEAGGQGEGGGQMGLDKSS